MQNVDNSCDSTDEQGEELSSSDCESPNDSTQVEDEDQHAANISTDSSAELHSALINQQSELLNSDSSEESQSAVINQQPDQLLSSDSSEESQTTLIDQQSDLENNNYTTELCDSNQKKNEVPKWIAWKWRWTSEAWKSQKLSEKVKELEVSREVSRTTSSASRSASTPTRGSPSASASVTTPLQSSPEVIPPIVFPQIVFPPSPLSSPSAQDMKLLTKQVSEISTCLNKMVPTLNFLVDQTKSLPSTTPASRSISTTRAGPPGHLAARKNSLRNSKLDQPQVQQNKQNLDSRMGAKPESQIEQNRYMGSKMGTKQEPQVEQNRGVYPTRLRLDTQETNRGMGLRMPSNQKPQDPFYQRSRSVSRPWSTPQRPEHPCQGVIPESAWIRPKDPHENERLSPQTRGYPMGNITNSVDPPPSRSYRPSRVHRKADFGPIPSKGSSTSKALHTLQVAVQHELQELMSLMGSGIGGLRKKKNEEGWKQSLLSVWELSTNVDQLLNKAKHKLPNAAEGAAQDQGMDMQDGTGNRSSVLKHSIITVSSPDIGRRSTLSENDNGIGMDEDGSPSHIRNKSCGASQQLAHWQGRQCVASQHAENLKHQIEKLQARHLAAYKRLQKQDDELLMQNLQRSPVV